MNQTEMQSDNGTESQTLFNPELEHSSCGVGFLTRKDGVQTHKVLTKAHEALCAVPHRGGMSSEGVGDGAGVSVDLSIKFFSKLVGKQLDPGHFGVGNFFLPENESSRAMAIDMVDDFIRSAGMDILHARELPVENSAIEQRGLNLQLPIHQWVFELPAEMDRKEVDELIYNTLLKIEKQAYTRPELEGLYPLSMSAETQVFKGRLSSWEIIPYFKDLDDPDHEVHTLFFHTRFSTNTDPHPSMAQPFRMMAHNGELNTDKKNRLSEAAIASAKNKHIIRPKGQSDSCRFDQTLHAKLIEENIDLVTAVVAMMPPAWENDESLSDEVRDMLAFFSLYEEKNDGPAALVFGDGNVIGARLDRLGLRPLRSVETDEYLAVMSEAGQVYFPPEEVIRLGRIEAGGMLYYDHQEKRIYESHDALEKLAAEKDYSALLKQAQNSIDDLVDPPADTALDTYSYTGDLTNNMRFVAYNLNQESFKFLMDPMLATGIEKVSAMGYGNAINALSDTEGGVAKFFSQRFAQVTNPPLDSIREADGMTLRVALGEKPHRGLTDNKQIIVNSPVLTKQDMLRIKAQSDTPWQSFEMLYQPVMNDEAANQTAITDAIDTAAAQVTKFALEKGGIAILSDQNVSRDKAVLPMTLVVSAVNQRLIEQGLRLKVSLVIESGQICSSHHIACALGFGGSAIYALSAQLRAEENYPDDPAAAYKKFAKASEKALMKTMGKVGLCTVESYSGGEFFEPNFLDTTDPVIKRYLPNMHSPVGGVRFDSIAKSATDWHQHALGVEDESDIPMLGLFKERAEGAGHSYGTMAVRGFVDMTEEDIKFSDADGGSDEMRLLTLRQMNDAFGITDAGYVNTSYEKLADAQVNDFKITPGYRSFSRAMAEERAKRPAALRDVLGLPGDFNHLDTAEAFERELTMFDIEGNRDFCFRGLEVCKLETEEFSLRFTSTDTNTNNRLNELAEALKNLFKDDITSTDIVVGTLDVRSTSSAYQTESGYLKITAINAAEAFLSRVRTAPDSIQLDEVQAATEITPRLASGAMSHGALVATAHEAVAHGINMAGGMSNSGEGGEHASRYGTIRASKIKQFASGRFGVWTGYLADPNLEEIEIKIAQGAKPGEGGQLPAAKVTVEIAAARGGTPGVELISPPPHHDTYSIEDLGQLIHDAKAARVRVIVKLVSSEGIGTIAVGVAKAGADVINVAGNTGGTGAAAVTSLKYTGRAAELGIAEVHQALCASKIRQKVHLRCSGAMQTGSDVVKASLMGGDSFEFGTTALMMLKCVMAKNCNVKCPAGLTTNGEVFDGDARALAQYLLNIAHEVREILASLGLRSLDEARGRADLLHLLDHPSAVGQIDVSRMLVHVPENHVENPTYLERDYHIDDELLKQVQTEIFEKKSGGVVIKGIKLNNCNKSVGGQLAIDIERYLNHEARDLKAPGILQDDSGRRYLAPGTVYIQTEVSAGQSYAAFSTEGLRMHHIGTCNDGVGKGACGGEIIITAPAVTAEKNLKENVLIGNFALFGATGGRLFVRGQAGDRFAVRNSGATAVVEGVGDFCCEYMTNGSVLNLGGFSKGFGNGMSGGFAYQYDPEQQFLNYVSHDSVITGKLTDDNPMADIHDQAIQQLLEWHINATGSPRAEKILANWSESRNHFVWLMPRALLQYQDADAILAAKSRKDLLEELSTALAAHQIIRLKKAWKSGKPVLHGQAPTYGETDSETMFELLNNWTVLDTAQELVKKRFQNVIDDVALNKLTKNLVMIEDFELMTRLAKHAKAALNGYDDAELAALIANKRLNDFKTALSARNIRSMDSPGSYGWIMQQTRRNLEQLGRIPSFEELFAGKALPERLLALTAS